MCDHAPNSSATTPILERFRGSVRDGSTGHGRTIAESGGFVRRSACGPRPFDRLRVALSEVEGRGAQPPSDPSTLKVALSQVEGRERAGVGPREH